MRPNRMQRSLRLFRCIKVLHESLTDGTQLVLLGAMLIGLMTGASGWLVMQSFVGHLFKGLLAFFLLDMGISAARNLHGLRGQSPWLIAYGLCAPLAHALLALVFCRLLGLPAGDTILLMVLAASASYIAVPAVLRYAIPEASPSLYMGLALGLTFPFKPHCGNPFVYGLDSAFGRLRASVIGLPENLGFFMWKFSS